MQYSLREPVNGLTHCIGAVLALAGSVLLLRHASAEQPLQLFALSVFSLGMMGMYTFSTLYHWLSLSEKGVRQWRRMDHCMIFIFIAATYTPICLLVLQGIWKWALLLGVWGLACGGIILKIVWLNAPRWLSTLLYLGMGWIALVAVYPLALVLPLGALLWLIAGGIAYSIGALIYALKKPQGFATFGFHAIFHIFVMLGSFCHFMVMYLYIVRLV